MSENQQYTF